MPKFRADHYLIAEFESVTDTKQVGDKVLAALKENPELKDLAIVTKRMEGKSWSEILGRIDVPAGSKAFWAMMTSDPTTQASAGSAVTESSGTYTFYPGEDGESATLFVVD